MAYQILFFALLALIVLGAVVFVPRIAKDMRLKKDKKNACAIQNVSTGLCIRPKDADFSEGNSVIQYPLKNWECITWQLIRVDTDAFLLQNLYTHKTFEPKNGAADGSPLIQRTLDGTRSQCWEFAENGGSCAIRLKGTELYLAAESKEKNTEIVLREKQNDDAQKWRLIEQHPVM